MKKAILATKVGMTQIFNENGVLTPVTVLQAGPCYVTQVLLFCAPIISKRAFVKSFRLSVQTHRKIVS